MKLKTTDSTLLPDKLSKKLFLFCAACGREFVYLWKKGTTKKRFCGSCKQIRRVESKRRYDLKQKEGGL